MRPEPSRPYRPQLPAKEWAAIEQYVSGIVARVEPHVSYPEREILAAVSRLVHFAYVNHNPLEDHAALSPRAIERFVQHHLAGYNRASRNTIRARLRRVSEALLGDDAAGRFKALGKAEVSRPYDEREISLLRAFGRSMRTDELISSAGAGLTGAEIIRQRIEGVDVYGVTVHVRGDNERTVPIDGQLWVDLLQTRHAALGGTGWAFRAQQRGSNINLITDFVSHITPQIPLVMRRMRATWLVGHLNAGTPLKLEFLDHSTGRDFDRLARAAVRRLHLWRPAAGLFGSRIRCLAGDRFAASPAVECLPVCELLGGL